MRRARSIPEIKQDPGSVAEVILQDLNLEAVPEEIRQCTQLRKLDLSQNNLAEVPEWLGELVHLEHLVLSHNPISTLPDALGRLEHLRKLELENGLLTQLPAGSSGWKNLQSLRLSRNRLQQLPEHLGEWENLSELVLHGNRLTRFPGQIERLERLHSVDLSGNQFLGFPRELIRLPQLSYLQFADNPLLENHPLDQLDRWIAQLFQDRFKYRLDLKQAEVALDVLLHDFAHTAGHPPELVFETLESQLAYVRNQAPVVLEEVLNDPFRENLPQTVVFSGYMPELSMQEAREQLEALGIAVAGNLPPSDAVLIVGPRPGRKLKQALQRQLPIGLPAHIKALLERNEGRFLDGATQQDAGMVANLVGMLQNENAENRALGLTMMEAGGVPPALYTELVLMWLFPEGEKEKDRSQLLLEQHGGRSLFSRLKSKLRQKEQRSMPLITFLEQIGHLPGIEKNELYQGALNRGLLQLDEVLGLEGIRLDRVLQRHMVKGRLNLSGLGLQQLPTEVCQLNGLQHLRVNRNDLTHLPVPCDQLGSLVQLELAENHLDSLPASWEHWTRLTHLDARHNRLHSLPQSTQGPPQLKQLNLSANPTFRDWRRDLSLPELEHLELRNCRLTAWSNQPETLPKLKALLLGGNQMAHLEESKFELPALEVLDLSSNGIAALPAQWLGLSALRVLDLRHNPLRQLPPTMVEAPRLEALYLPHQLDWEVCLPILGKMPELKAIWLDREPVAALSEHLRKALPGIRMEW